MERNFSPPRGKSLVVNGVVTGLLLAAILFLLISGSTTNQGTLAIILVAFGFLLIIPLLLAIYRIITIVTTVYSLNRDTLEVKWGLRRELIPMREIDWVHPASDFETPLPLTFAALRGSFYGETKIKGLGKTLFVATTPDQMVLVKLSEAYLVISPEDKKAFTETFKQISQLGSLQQIQPESENLRMLWQRVMDDHRARNLLLGSSISLGALIIIAGVFISLKPTVVWVSFETVPSARLVLLALIGLLFTLANTLLGLFLYLQERIGRDVVYLIWSWSILNNVILGLAIVFMGI